MRTDTFASSLTSTPQNLKVYSVLLSFDFLFALPQIAYVIRLILGLEKSLAFLSSQCKSLSCTCGLCFKVFQMNPWHFSNSLYSKPPCNTWTLLEFCSSIYSQGVYCLYSQELSLLHSHPSPTLEKSVEVWPCLDARHPPEILYSDTLLHNGTGERKQNKRFMNWDKGRERSLTNYCHGHYRLDLQKSIEIIIINQKSEQENEK